MRRAPVLVIATALAVELYAQQPAPTPPAAAAPAAADTPAPTPEVAGSVEVGFRWIVSSGGNNDVYRSVVDLGQGPKLLNADLNFQDPTHRFFDEAEFRASSWGDPYNTMYLDVRRNSLYHLNINYQNIAYFNFLPSFANPALGAGVLASQNASDTFLKTLDVQLDLFPARKFRPYIAYSHNSQEGSGITVFQDGANEYPVASLVSSQNNLLRAGVATDLGPWHFTLEEGATRFSDAQGASDNQQNFGDRGSLYLGQQLVLDQLDEQYRTRGTSAYTKALVAAAPASWVNLSGSFIYSDPSIHNTYTDTQSGASYLVNPYLFFMGAQALGTAGAQAPHTTANGEIELRPWRRVRILESWMTDRYHDASAALLDTTYFVTAGSQMLSSIGSDRLQLNFNQEQLDIFYDLTSFLTLHGGYRYVWGDADVRAPVLLGSPSESGDLSRQIGIGGFTAKFGHTLRVRAEAEGGSSGEVYFRTSLRNYQRVRVVASWQPWKTWRFSGDFSLLDNSDPDPAVQLDFKSKYAGLSANWTPGKGKLFNLLLDYSRSSVRSSVLYLEPELLTPEISNYTENAHTGTALAQFRWISVGGSFFVSSGSRPTQYYQPLARVAIPLHKNIEWSAEWRWYGFAERFYAFENFRSNQVMTSLRFER